jgi:hypothetical protein
LILIGVRTWIHMLGTKLEECLQCGVIGQHLLIRRSEWFTIFFIPILPLGIRYGLTCVACKKWTKIPRGQMTRGIREGRLPLDTPRPKFDATEPDYMGNKPTAAQFLDPIVRNDKTTLSYLYMRIWPALAGVAVVAIAVSVAFSIVVGSPKTPMGQKINANLESRYGKAHDCWDSGITVNGCRLQNGTQVGSQVGTLTVCYFNEPMPDADQTITCDHK